MSSRGECVRNEIELTTIIFSFFPIRACSREVVRRAQCSPSFFLLQLAGVEVSPRDSLLSFEKLFRFFSGSTQKASNVGFSVAFMFVIKNKAHWILMKMFSDKEKRTAKLPTIFICFSDRARQPREEKESAEWWVKKKKKVFRDKHCSRQWDEVTMMRWQGRGNRKQCNKNAAENLSHISFNSQALDTSYAKLNNSRECDNRHKIAFGRSSSSVRSFWEGSRLSLRHLFFFCNFIAYCCSAKTCSRLVCIMCSTHSRFPTAHT